MIRACERAFRLEAGEALALVVCQGRIDRKEAKS
ncbi:MAG: hypothetical protein QOJ16_3892, partial [Acidobacteriota bacterium]|nr:hypothetical protein [Acidobacteriota bacterium]